jgi:hypothetical protein
MTAVANSRLATANAVDRAGALRTVPLGPSSASATSVRLVLKKKLDIGKTFIQRLSLLPACRARAAALSSRIVTP